MIWVSSLITLSHGDVNSIVCDDKMQHVRIQICLCSTYRQHKMEKLTLQQTSVRVRYMTK